MLEKFLDEHTYQEFKHQTANIDKLAQWAFLRNCKLISEKYSNIDTTVKILNNLVVDFLKKADKMEKNLLLMAKVSECEFQKNYYEKRVGDCMELSALLQQEITLQKQKVADSESQVNLYKQQLIKLKSDNIKLVMQIEQIQKINAVHTQSNSLAIKRTRHEPHFKVIKKRKELSNEEVRKNEVLQHELATRISQARQLGEAVEEIFRLLRSKLKKHETKAGGFGLAGSMLFKMKSQDMKKEQFFRHRGKTDAKLLIYDVLRNKYQRLRVEQEKEKQSVKVSLEEFMQYSPMQIMGLLEVKGGVEVVRWKHCSPKLENVKVVQNCAEAVRL